MPWLKSVMAEECYQTNMFQKPSIDNVDAAVAVPVINPVATFTGQVWPQTMQRLDWRNHQRGDDQILADAAAITAQSNDVVNRVLREDSS